MDDSVLRLITPTKEHFDITIHVSQDGKNVSHRVASFFPMGQGPDAIASSRPSGPEWVAVIQRHDGNNVELFRVHGESLSSVTGQDPPNYPRFAWITLYWYFQDVRWLPSSPNVSRLPVSESDRNLHFKREGLLTDEVLAKLELTGLLSNLGAQHDSYENLFATERMFWQIHHGVFLATSFFRPFQYTLSGTTRTPIRSMPPKVGTEVYFRHICVEKVSISMRVVPDLQPVPDPDSALVQSSRRFTVECTINERSLGKLNLFWAKESNVQLHAKVEDWDRGIEIQSVGETAKSRNDFMPQ